MRAGAVGRAEADDRLAGDEGRARVALRRGDGGGDGGGVVAVDPLHMPAIGGEAGRRVVGEGEAGMAVDRDAVIVIEDDHLAKAEMPGQRAGLVAGAFLHIAVAGDHIGEMVDQPFEAHRQMGLGDGHADRGRQALAQRAGRGLDARLDMVLGMARGAAAGLAEQLQIVQPHRLVAGQVIQRVEQHRAVAGRQHEPVAVRPGGVGRVELQEAAVEHGGDIGHAHRQAGMAGIRLLDPVEGQEANGVRQFVMRDSADCRCVLSHVSTPCLKARAGKAGTMQFRAKPRQPAFGIARGPLTSRYAFRLTNFRADSAAIDCLG